MLPIILTSSEWSKVEALKAKLSLKPLLLQGLDEEAGESAFEVVRGILRDVQHRGDAAVLELTAKFDKATLTADTMRVGPYDANRLLDELWGKSLMVTNFNEALDVAIANLRRYQQAMLTPEPAPISIPGTNARLGVKFTSLERVGLYVPRRRRRLPQQRPAHRHPRPGRRRQRPLPLLPHA